MEKMKKKYKKIILPIIIVTLSCFILFSFATHVYLLICGDVDEYIEEKTNIYIPKSTPKKYHSTIFSIDTFDYWIFKLDEIEVTEIELELENGNWSKLELCHMLKLSEIDYLKIIGKYSSLQNNCYLCIYDLTTGEIITNSEKSILVDSSNWAVFFYNKENNYYCCIHERQ